MLYRHLQINPKEFSAAKGNARPVAKANAPKQASKT